MVRLLVASLLLAMPRVGQSMMLVKPNPSDAAQSTAGEAAAGHWQFLNSGGQAWDFSAS
jgi:hypothetical protein